MAKYTIPLTAPDRYISFKAALNLRLPDEDTGDWHDAAAYFRNSDGYMKNLLAGEGCHVDTRPSLGDKGVRDMRSVVSGALDGMVIEEPVHVANHYRAIADMTLPYFMDGRTPEELDNSTINAWLDTREQVDELRMEYIRPLRSQLDNVLKELFDRWVHVVQFS